MKSIYIILITSLFITAGIYAEQNFYYKSSFDRGDVITVLTEQFAESYSLELLSSRKVSITRNMFFYLESSYFKGYASVIGLDSTLKAGEYILQIRNGDDSIVCTDTVLIHENLFKKENIKLNYSNTSLRTDTNPEITRQAFEIHEIYGTSDNNSVFSSNSFVSPLKDGIITSWYGDRRKFIYSDGKYSKSIHNGIDIAAPVGTEIYAGSEGKVVLSNSRIITGNSIVIEYLPGVYGVFFHMDEIYVSPGDIVSKDTVIGTLGATGLATGPHLHWEFRVGGVPVNPDAFLANGLIDNSLIMSIVSNHTAE
jgi:Peptidase family M23